MHLHNSNKMFSNEKFPFHLCPPSTQIPPFQSLFCYLPTSQLTLQQKLNYVELHKHPMLFYASMPLLMLSCLNHPSPSPPWADLTRLTPCSFLGILNRHFILATPFLTSQVG